MKPLMLIGINFALLASVILILRFWLRKHPHSLAAQHRLCGFIQWLGVLNAVAAAIIGFVIPMPATGLSLASSGLLVVTSMTLKRKQLSRLLAKRQK
jgi:hypothetical protein